MTALEIVQELFLFAQTLKKSRGELFPGGVLHISRSYDFISLAWSDIDDNLVAKLVFKCSGDLAGLESLYCEDPALEESVSKAIPISMALIKEPVPILHSVHEHLHTADLIAGLTKDCSAGDDYHPGNFSSVLLTDRYIILSQINHMNAKSLAHKNDYSLRDLVFLIPLAGSPNINFHYDYQSGEMLIRFDDRSSENNRKYGDKVKGELERLPGGLTNR